MPLSYVLIVDDIKNKFAYEFITIKSFYSKLTLKYVSNDLCWNDSIYWIFLSSFFFCCTKNDSVITTVYTKLMQSSSTEWIVFDSITPCRITHCRITETSNPICHIRCYVIRKSPRKIYCEYLRKIAFYFFQFSMKYQMKIIQKSFKTSNLLHFSRWY